MSLILLSDVDDPFTARDEAGRALPFATLDFFVAGTSQPADDLDADGHFEADADGIFAAIDLTADVSYRVVHKTADGVLVYDVDPYVCTCGVGDPIFRSPIQRAFDADDRIAPGALLYSFGADGVTPVSLYADADLERPLANPIVANAAGAFPSPIYSDDDSEYVLELRDSDGNLLEEFDPYVCECGAVTPVSQVGFTVNGTWQVPAGVTQIDALLVGGGGYGMDFATAGALYPGGGGGGAVRVFTAIPVTPLETLTISIGVGGTFGGTGGTTELLRTGGTVLIVDATGGTPSDSNNGVVAGNAGGESSLDTGQPPGTAPGNDGGNASAGTAGGGGGGAGADGGDASVDTGGNGGIGLVPDGGSWGLGIGETGFFGGGGAGAGAASNGTRGTGGGGANTGGGGNAASFGAPQDGWSGFLAIRYATP